MATLSPSPTASASATASRGTSATRRDSGAESSRRQTCPLVSPSCRRTCSARAQASWRLAGPFGSGSFGGLLDGTHSLAWRTKVQWSSCCVRSTRVESTWAAERLRSSALSSRCMCITCMMSGSGLQGAGPTAHRIFVVLRSRFGHSRTTTIPQTSARISRSTTITEHQLLGPTACYRQPRGSPSYSAR